MPQYRELLQKSLENRFFRTVSWLYPVIGENEFAAWQRLEIFCKAASIALPLLAEPWWKRMDNLRLHIFNACADIHLYARVLDDAIDNGLPCQKTALLKMQEIFWQASSLLAKTRPGLTKAAMYLIRETTEAAGLNQETPCDWARKNHHLLLIPLYLAPEKSFFEKYRQCFSLAIGILQAEDEMKQGQIKEVQPFCGYMEKVAENAVQLKNGGWPTLAQRVVNSCKRLLADLEHIKKHGYLF